MPAYRETGLPELRNYSYRSWVGFTAPAGIPPAAAQRLEKALVDAVQTPEVRQSLIADWVRQPDGSYLVEYDFVLNPAK